MTRAILFDTETTGLNPLGGDRVIEIAALELMDDLPTGQSFHTLIDPERDIPAEASRVHGLYAADLAGKPRFSDIAAAMVEFFGDARLIAHNAPFDIGFLDMELGRAGHAPLGYSRMVDTLAIAKQRFPGMPNSLDALCRRFGIDLSQRTTHNALLDCKLLADVYIELIGGRQRGLVLAGDGGPGRRGAGAGAGMDTDLTVPALSHDRAPRPMRVTAAEQEAHTVFVATLKAPVWRMD
jgi:DNA polymerase-3 subunit epsilon